MKNQLLKNSVLAIALLFTSSLFAQDWVKMMQDPTVNFYDVQKAFNSYYAKAEPKVERNARKLKRESGQVTNEREGEVEVPGTEIYKRWEWFMAPRVSPTGERFAPDAVWNAMKEYRQGYNQPMAGNWTSLGPNTPSGIPGIGRINAIRVHPTNPSTIYICSPAGGLWTSTNGGSSWTTNTDQLQVLGCSDLAFDPTNPNTMYLATGDGDGGDNYSVGLLKSTNGGTTWNTTGLSFALSAFKQIKRVLVDPSNGNNIIVASTAGIYRSTDAGTTFTMVQAGSFFDAEFMPGTPATIYTCGTEFYKSINSGATWTKLTANLPAATAVQRMAMAVSANAPSTIYLIVSKITTYDIEGLYQSTNGGTSWTKKGTPNIGTQGFYDLCIAANPTNANEIMFGGQTQFYKSTNSGTTNTLIASTTHVDYHDVYYVDGTTAYLTSDGGVWKSTNNGTSWSDLSSGLVISELYGFGQSTTNASKILGGWQDNGSNSWNGTSWGAQMGGDGMLAFISWNNDNTMWCSQYNGSLNRTTGAGWSAMSGISGETCPWVTEWNEDPVTGGTVYAGCQNVWKATAGTFTKLTGNVAGTSTVGITSIAVSPASNQVMWVAKGGLYKTTNGGTAWTAVTSLPSGTITDIICSPTDVNKAWVCFGGFTNVNKIFQTTNQGTSWTNLSASLPNIPMNCMVIDKNTTDGIYIGTDAGVYYKDATMQVWQPFSTGLPNVTVTQLNIYYAGSKLRASTYGRGVWESGLYQAGAYAPDANFGADKQYGCPGLAVQFTDYTSGQPTGWSWTFQGGNPATSTAQNPLVAYNTPGTYSVSLTATNANGTDSQTYNSFVTISSAGSAPTSTGASFCAPGSVSLSAAATAGAGTLRWWNQPAGGTIVNTGTAYTTPTLTTTTTYYVDESFAAGNIDFVGEIDNTVGAGAMFSANDIRGLFFDVSKPVVINTVQVYSQTAGLRTIEILDANGNWVTDTTLNIPASPSALTTVTINRTIYPGTNYFIKFRGTVDCYRNSAGGVFPYVASTTPSPITITGTNAGLPGYYYFFYNWKFTNIVCNTPRTPVVATNTCSTTGINDVFADHQIEVYPNPSTGEFTAMFNIENNDNYVVKVSNELGQIVYEEKLDNFSGIYSKKIDISSYRKGVYMLSVSNLKNKTVKKIVVY